MVYHYTTNGTCSKTIDFEIEDGTVKDVKFVGGCNGNLQGIGALVRGMKVGDVIARLEGLRCRDKNTSCPDQLATALKLSLLEETKE